MKYIVILIDGAADYPVEELGGKTPLMAAQKPNIDRLAQRGEVGLVKTIPKDMPAGSDVANLSVLGYDTHKYYSGRSPLEALSMGIPLNNNDTTFRANLVTLSDELNYRDKIMVDYSSDEIGNHEAAQLISALNDQLKSEDFTLYPGISYRHLLLYRNKLDDCGMTPPHDISGRCIGGYLPKQQEFLGIMKASNEILKNHPLNAQRIMQGKKPANSLWFWGQGTKPILPSFKEKYGLSGCVISAVDLIKGIGICAGMCSIDVEGATGTLHTNFEGKAAAAIKALNNHDFIYLHLEAADECGHHFDAQGKVRSIELIDEKIVAPISEYLNNSNMAHKLLVLPDHPTPIATGTHANDPVPYIIYNSTVIKSGVETYNETSPKESFNLPGYRLMDYFIKGTM